MNDVKQKPLGKNKQKLATGQDESLFFLALNVSKGQGKRLNVEKNVKDKACKIMTSTLGFFFFPSETFQ